MIDGSIATCVGKRPFPTFPEANKCALHIRHRVGARVKPYRCPFCRLWHVGNKRR